MLHQQQDSALRSSWRIKRFVEAPPRWAFQKEFSSHDIRAVTARMAHPNDPLAEWRFDFAEWRKTCADFREMEQEQTIQNDAPSALTLRQDRYELFLLKARIGGGVKNYPTRTRLRPIRSG